MTGFESVTTAQQAAGARGDFHRIGVSQQVVGELLGTALHIHAGERVLDVAGGAGNTAIAAARRRADVTCTDYVPDLLGHAEDTGARRGPAACVPGSPTPRPCRTRTRAVTW